MTLRGHKKLWEVKTLPSVGPGQLLLRGTSRSSWGGRTVPLEEGAHEGVDAHELQLDVVPVKGHPLAISELLDHDAVLLGQTNQPRLRTSLGPL